MGCGRSIAADRKNFVVRQIGEPYSPIWVVQPIRSAGRASILIAPSKSLVTGE